jgi:thimet oligopeptidase
MSYAKSDHQRFELYKKYRKRGFPQNQEVLQKLLEKRYELAKTLGYENYAQYVTKDKMIKNPQNAADFINKVVDVATDRANKDYEELLRRLKIEMPEATNVEDWQKTYISELVKLEAYGLDSRKIRQYFSYDRVRDGLIKLTEDLFAVKIKRVQYPAWHSSVEVYELWSEKKLIGRFYLDMHPRKDKYKHAMMTQVITGISGKQIPEAALVCNFPGGDGSQGLMEHDQVGTFFHEFGHLMHHLFAGDQPWIRISGIQTEWDFVETPSSLFEEWVWDVKILQKFAINEKGEPIPDEIVKKMNRARKFRLGLDTKQQMFYASISLNFYNNQPGSFVPLDMVKTLQKKITPFNYVDDTYMHLAFGHLDGYSAIYYTYMWSSVIAKDLYSVFKKEGLENREVALRYRKAVLEPGGAKEASQLVKDFMGREFSFEAFADWLNADSI